MHGPLSWKNHLPASRKASLSLLMNNNIPEKDPTQLENMDERGMAALCATQHQGCTSYCESIISRYVVS